MTITLSSYDPTWPLLYKEEKKALLKALGENCLSIHHFGSTAIPEISAKPKIDILVEVTDFSLIDNKALVALDYEIRGEVIKDGRYFSKKSPFRFHLHAFESSHPAIEKNIRFRNWLRDHESDRKAYEELKKHLASIHTEGIEYAEAKSEFFNMIMEKSLDNKV